MMARPVRTLLVEDEPHARRYLRELLADDEQIVIVGEASNGIEGAELIRALAPDLVFLDIQMPEADGFALIARASHEVPRDALPAFVFVTAFDEYAVRAFDVEAVDYLCKPFGRDRLATAVERALRHLRAREVTAAASSSAVSEGAIAGGGEGLASAAAGAGAGAGGGVAAAANAGAAEDDEARVSAGIASIGGASSPWLARIAIKEEEGITFVSVSDILWIEAANKYVVIHTPQAKHIARQTVQSLAQELDPAQFVRVHRSILVRKSAVRGLHPLFHGDYVLRLTNGTELTLSRTFRDAFFAAMSR